ncbi:MAG: LptE family protein [Candidatus Aureabacteria bacterium]|nr:LptE family protein [Candidatus Auribacterota bacterium]
MKKVSVIASLLCVGICLAGCGYRIGSVNPDDPIKSVYIPNVKNKTTEPAIEARATSKIVTAFQIDGSYMVVNQDDADAILDITLISYNRSALRFDKNDITREYRLTIGADLVLRDAKTNKVVYTAKRVEGEKAFFVTITLPESERIAVPFALEDLADHVVERITERW